MASATEISAVKIETDRELLSQSRYRISIARPCLKTNCRSANAGIKNPHKSVAPQNANAKKAFLPCKDFASGLDRVAEA